MVRKEYKESIHPISGVLESVVRKLGLANGYHGWLIVNKWPQLAGERIARVAKAYRFEDGVLYVAVKDDAWRQELTMQTDSILYKIRQLPYGKVVRQIRLVGNRKGT